jgi:hypothetical protein
VLRKFKEEGKRMVVHFSRDCGDLEYIPSGNSPVYPLFKKNIEKKQVKD